MRWETYIATLEHPIALAVVVDLIPEPKANKCSPSDILTAR